jgi:peroxiredoxin
VSLIQPGPPAPDFKLIDERGEPVTRDGLTGQTTVLVFYLSKAFGAYHALGFSHRAIVILDPDGIVRWSYEAPNPGELPGANPSFEGLDALAPA